MSTARAYWGDLRLWYYGRTYTEAMRRGARITHMGVDREEALPVGSNPNFTSEVEVVTFFAPPKVSSVVPYTREAFRAHVAGLMDALKVRAGLTVPGATLVWVEDNTKGGSVSGYAAGVYTTSAPHGLTSGDRVLLRKNATVRGYAYGTATVTASDKFTLSALETGSGFVAGTGFDVLLVERAWPGHFFDSMEPVRSRGQGDYFDPAATFRFFGSRASVYTRTTVDLDATL